MNEEIISKSQFKRINIQKDGEIKRLEKRIEVECRKGYLEGYIDAVTDYAIWKDGQQLVGCLQKPLREVIAPKVKELKEFK